MPSTNDTPHRHAKKASPVRRKAKLKPKFEIPIETAPEAATAWVYRADEVPEQPVVRPVATEIPRPHQLEEPQPSVENEDSHPLLMATMAMISLGVGAVGLMSFAAITMFTVPMRLARGIWGTEAS